MSIHRILVADDEESIRWLHHLFRYYGIEGNTLPRPSSSIPAMTPGAKGF